MVSQKLDLKKFYGLIINFMAAHKNHQKEDYKRMRAVVFWLHDNRCFITQKKESDLECHHCNHNSLDNDLLNLVPLSKQAHKLITISKGSVNITVKQIIRLLELKLLHYKNML